MPRWDINLSWEGAYPTKIRTQKRWTKVAHNKSLIMGRRKQYGIESTLILKFVSPQWKQISRRRGEISLSVEGAYPEKIRAHKR